MRNENNFINEINHSNVALEADFRCDCGSENFRIMHSGTFHKGIFGGVSIKKREKQLVVKCNCSNCLKEYILFDSTRDGVNPKGISDYEFSSLEINGETVFQVKLKYNFMENNYKTDLFEMIFLEVKSSKMNKYLAIYEE